MKIFVFFLIYYITDLPHMSLANQSEGIEYHIILFRDVKGILVLDTDLILSISQNYVPNIYVKMKEDVR